MESPIPKVLLHIGEEPMLVKIIKEVMLIRPQTIYVVVGKYYEMIKNVVQTHIPMDYNIEYVVQDPPLGTGHAIQCCRSQIKQHLNSNVLILSGDVPLIKAETMHSLLYNVQGVRITTTVLDNPHGYGRIIEQNNEFERIVEEKDCNDEEREIQRVNCGIYAFNAQLLWKYLHLITNENAQKEYYLTDLVGIIKTREQIPIEILDIPSHKQIEIIGVNTKQQLSELSELKYIYETFDKKV
jgi:bifunctional UDP-N-acetylglucosamine pyrophosphorylase/glucosamine-1-phosphate N-acetyltransferase